jgi:phospholipase D1/2
MVHSIHEAKHFIYIENQYFISNTAGGKVRNEIASALVQRIRKAILEKKIRSLAYPNFRVIVVLPVHP